LLLPRARWPDLGTCLEMSDINISFGPRQQKRNRLRAYYHQYTREPRGSETEWQKRLTELDPNLFLRWSYLFNQYLVFYDYKGLMTAICKFGHGEFGKAFLNVKHNATLNARKLRRMKKEEEEKIEKDFDERIDECAEEFGEELHNATKERLISDPTIEPQHRKKEDK